MPRRNNKINFLHGFVAILIGLVILIWGPIDFRGAAVDRWVGTIVIIFGFAVVMAEIFRKRSKNKSKQESDQVGS
jgi:uncharacterized membrane protein HdeD (DUF308 family)